MNPGGGIGAEYEMLKLAHSAGNRLCTGKLANELLPNSTIATGPR